MVNTFNSKQIIFLLRFIALQAEFLLSPPVTFLPRRGCPRDLNFALDFNSQKKQNLGFFADTNIFLAGRSGGISEPENYLKYIYFKDI